MVYIIVAFFTPYASRAANIVEALVLGDLLLLTGLFLNVSDRAKAVIHPLSQLLLLLPYISATLYIIFKLASLIW